MSNKLDKIKFSEVVKGKREGKELGLRETAKITGVSASTLSRIENGETFDVDTLIKLLD